MAELRATLGPGAIILGTECARNGKISIRAAAEHAPSEDVSTSSASQDNRPHHAEETQYDDYQTIEAALNFHRVPQIISGHLLNMLGSVNANDAVQALAAVLDMRYSFAPLPVQNTRPVLLIGPSGAGKTITAAKLAARSLLAGHNSLLITTDLVRAGGAEQLAAYAASMNTPLHRAAAATEVPAILEAQKEPVNCFIDTTGASPYNLDDLKALRKLVMAVDCDPVLVLPAGGDAMEACEMVNIFSGLGARGVIISKLDATRRFGSILGAMEAAAMTLHQVSITPYVANGLAPLASTGLARLLLEDPMENNSYSELEQAAQ